MKWILIFALLVPGSRIWAEQIKVRIKRAKAEIEFSGLGLFIKNHPNHYLPVGLPEMKKAKLRLINNHGRFPVWEVRYEGDKQPLRLVGEKVFVEAESLRLGLSPVPQQVQLVAGEQGRVDVIAELDLEKYLTGVLPSEMPAKWPTEALKAQVVASRSYAMAIKRQRRFSSYHLESSVMDQVFDLNNHVGASDYVRKKVADIVRQTRGQYLADNKGNPIKAYYHADCGGGTERAKAVWGDEGFEPGTTHDAYCPLSPLARWRFTMSRDEMREILAAHFGIGPGLHLESVSVMGRTASRRVANVAIVFSDREKRVLSSHEFRRLLGFNNLKSTNFSLFWRADRVVLEGRGHGHGVGLCQYGARQLAVRGMNYREILKNYYSNAQLIEPGVGLKVDI